MVAGVHCVHGPKGRETGASTRRDPGIRTMYIQRVWGTQGPEAVCANTKYPVILYPDTFVSRRVQDRTAGMHERWDAV